MSIELFRMERMQSLHWHRVKYDLSESGVRPLSVGELLGDGLGASELLDTRLGYPLSEGSELLRRRIADFHPGADARNVTVVNGGSEANHLTLWALARPGDRIAFMVPNYMQGPGLGRHFGGRVDTFALRLAGGRWQLDREGLARAVSSRTRIVMVCNPNNPTGAILSAEEMELVIAAARRASAWIVADEIYRGAERNTDVTTPSFWGRYARVAVTGGLSKAFALPGLRIGWVVAPEALIRRIWLRHDYTTLTPGMLSDRLATAVLEPAARERVLARTRSIIRSQWPPLAAWLTRHADIFAWAAPEAGAIAYARHRLPGRASALVDLLREKHSVLLVPGDMLGAGKGIRFGFGYDIEHTLAGLARVEATLRRLVPGRRSALSSKR